MGSAIPYGLTNGLFGPQTPLRLNAASIFFGLEVGASNGIVWYFIPLAYSTYRICTTYGAVPSCMDILNDGTGDRTRVVLAQESTTASGQQWTLFAQSDGTSKLSNEFTGAGWYLDTYTDGTAFMSSKLDEAGQHWTIRNLAADQAASLSSAYTPPPVTIPSGAIASSPASSTVTTTPSASSSITSIITTTTSSSSITNVRSSSQDTTFSSAIFSSTSSTSSTPTSQAATTQDGGGGGGGLSTSDKIALGVGLGIGIPTLIATVWGICIH